MKAVSKGLGRTMHESLQRSYPDRESQIESLYRRLLTVKSLEEQKQILQELETVIGLRLIYE
jgi:uncharacterized protein YjcR